MLTSSQPSSFFRTHSLTRQNGRIEPYETLLLFIGLIVIFATFRAILLNSDDDRESGTIVFQLVTLGFYGPATFILLRNFPSWIPRMLWRALPLVLLLVWVIASASWSAVPNTTLRRGFALILTSTFALYIVSRYQLEEVLKLIFWVAALFIVMGFLATAVGMGVHREGQLAGAWQGFTGHKNEFGRVLAYLIACFIIIPIYQRSLWRYCWPICIPLLFALLMLSDSKTSLLSIFVGVGGAFFLNFMLKGRLGKIKVGSEIRVILGVLIIAMLVVLLVFVLPLIFEVIGRDMTLTGRARIWSFAIAQAPENTFIGAGYRTFWIDAHTIYFGEMLYNPWGVRLGPTNGHSGYIDLWLELGWVGVGLFVWLLFSSFAMAKRAFEVGANLPAMMLAMTISFILPYSITERVILQQTESVWFMFTLLYFYCAAIAIRVPRHLPPQKEQMA